MDGYTRRRADSLNRKTFQQSSPLGKCMVNCTLQRNTFLPGEQVRGTIKFGVLSEDQDSIGIEEATVQAHGYVKVDPRWIALPTSLRSLFQQEDPAAAGADGAQKTTSQGVPIPRYSGLADDKSACVFASDVATLLEKDRVDREDPPSFRFSFVLPDKLTPTFRGVGVRYAYAVTVRIRRALPPPPPPGRLLSLVRRRPVAPASGPLPSSASAAGFSTTDVHVAFTVLSGGLPDTLGTGDGAGMGSGMGHGGGGGGGAERGVFFYDGGGSGKEGVGVGVGGSSGWGRVAFAELEAERQSRNEFKLEAERAKAGGLVSGTRAVTWDMQGRIIDDGYGGVASSSAPLLGEEDGNANGDRAQPPPMVFSIRSGEHRIGSFILHKADFCAGDIVLGNFDFSGASTRCLQVCACLEVCEENQNSLTGDAATQTPLRRNASEGGKGTCHKRVVDSCKELTPCLVQSSVTLSVPMDAPVTFSTGLVSVSWSLRFEFVIAPPESRWNIGGFSPSKASVLKWAVPIRVVPPRRIVLAGAGGAGGGGSQLGFNAMDATGRSVVC